MKCHVISSLLTALIVQLHLQVWCTCQQSMLAMGCVTACSPITKFMGRGGPGMGLAIHFRRAWMHLTSKGSNLDSRTATSTHAAAA
jgi:hypothetical protein